MNVKANYRKELNRIAARYSGWRDEKDILKFYDEIEKLGVIIPCWSAWEGDTHSYTIDGEEVENSMVVIQKYYSDSHGYGRCEYNIYFS